MGLRRKKEPANDAPGVGASSGRALIVYFLPTVIVALLLFLALAFVAWQAINRANEDAATLSAEKIAEALARQVESTVSARRDLMALALADGAAGQALATRDKATTQRFENELQRRLPGALQVRLLPRGLDQTDPGGAAPMGYAGLDMLRRTVETQRPSAAEVHQIESGAPYLAMAMPVAASREIGGALFVAWDLRPLIRLVGESPGFPGQLALLQGGAEGYVVAKGPGDLDAGSGGDTVPVGETIWAVRYATSPNSAGIGELGLTSALVGGGALVLLLTLVLQWRSLSRDLRADMGVVVTLSEAILRREPAPPSQTHVSSCADAIALLDQYVRDARGTPIPADATAKAPVPAAVAAGSGGHGLSVEELDTDPAELLGSKGGAATQAVPPQIEIPKSIFRAYDIRGVVGDVLTPKLAGLIGQAVGTLVREEGGRNVAIGRDARLSSPELATALIDGINASGCDVLDIGVVPTPLLYFAMQTQPVQAGVMVTGSHNPASYNGFKTVIGDRVLDGDGLQQMRERIQQGRFHQGSGQIERVDVLGDYLDAVNREVQIARPLKVVVDAGNGVAGETTIAVLESLGCEVVPLFCEPDGSFPNHHPDPSEPENLSALILEVQAQEADLGIALDGDGDRLGVIDNAGNIIWPDRLLMLLAADVLGRHPGVDILFDVKSSRHLASFVLSHGGRPIMWQAGHSRMRAKMLETGALLGGEFSGHLYIKERWYGFDDAIYAAARVLEILALEPQAPDALFAALPASPSSPEYRLVLEEGQSAELMRALDAHKVFDDARLVELDGLRVEFADGWGLIRPSNTTPSLTFRFEADTDGALEKIKTRFRELLRRVAPDMQPPF